MKKHLTLSILFVAVLLALEAMPCSAVLHFAADTETVISYFSYFDPTPFGYAVFGPLITALLTVVLAIELAVLIFKNINWLRRASAVTSVAMSVASLSPVLLGVRYMTNVSWCISIVAICTSVLLYIYARHMEK